MRKNSLLEQPDERKAIRTGEDECLSQAHISDGAPGAKKESTNNNRQRSSLNIYSSLKMRSLRRSHRVKITSYTVGDPVEVMHSDGVYFKGKIIRKASTSSPTNPLWIVSLRDGRRRNREVHERSLRKLDLEDSATDETTKTRSPRSKKEKKRGNINTTKQSSSTSSSDLDDKLGSSDFIESHLEGSEKLSLQKKTSGKKRRSSGVLHGRATAKKQKVVSFQGQSGKRQRSQRVSTRSSSRNDPETEFAVLPIGFKTARRGGSKKGGPRPGAKSKNEEVVKVKMLTGTLYLYRGENRRAEFIRFF